MKKFLVRGILIGGSLGVILALAGLAESMPRAFALGVVGGAFAGLTLGLRQRRKDSGKG